MKLRRGCGCPILILGILNLVMVVATILSLARGSTSSTLSSGTTKLGSVFFLLVFAGNVLACAIVGLASVRGEMAGSNTGRQATGEDEGTEDTDEHTDSSEP